jgi:hypothetical protein
MFWSRNTAKDYSRDNFFKYPDIVSPPPPPTNRYSKTSKENKGTCNRESKSVSMSHSANLRVTRSESGDQNCTHCGTPRNKNKRSALKVLKGLVPAESDSKAPLVPMNVLGSMTYPCNNIHAKKWEPRLHNAKISCDASNTLTYSVICFLDRKISIQAI